MRVVGSHQRVFSQVESEWDLCFKRIVLLQCGRTDVGSRRWEEIRASTAIVQAGDGGHLD